jgi:hypothetical protein
MGTMYGPPDIAVLIGMGRSPIADFQGLGKTDWKSWNRTSELQIPKNGVPVSKCLWFRIQLKNGCPISRTRNLNNLGLINPALVREMNDLTPDSHRFNAVTYQVNVG